MAAGAAEDACPGPRADRVLRRATRRLRHRHAARPIQLGPRRYRRRILPATWTGRRGRCGSTRSIRPATFRIDRLDVTPRPTWTLASDALRRKLRLLRAYRNTGPVLGRGLALFLTRPLGTGCRQVAARVRRPAVLRHGFYEPEAAYEKWKARRRLTRRGPDRAAHLGRRPRRVRHEFRC